MSEDKPKTNIGLNITVSPEAADKIVNKIGDIISPFSEVLGFLGDKIRERRQKNVIKYFESLNPEERKRFIEHPNELSERILLGASKVDPADDRAIWWRQMLKNSIENDNSDNFIYVDLMDKMSTSDVRFLNSILDRYTYTPDKERIEIERKVSTDASPIGIMVQNCVSMISSTSDDYKQKLVIFQEHRNEILGMANRIKTLKMNNCELIMTMDFVGINISSYTIDSLLINNAIALDRCKYLGLLEPFLDRIDVDVGRAFPLGISSTGARFSRVGWEFVSAYSPQFTGVGQSNG